MSSQKQDLDDQWRMNAMDPELSDREKALRDLFVNEYLVDYNAILAAQRCGFQKAFAEDYAVKFMGESYVQKRIQAVIHQPVDTKVMEQYDKETVLAVLRKEMQNPMGTAAARVAAASKMATILAMDKPVEPVNPNANKGGVLMVPVLANIEDWEAAAIASQQRLVSDARH
jgi:hypothetical protein